MSRKHGNRGTFLILIILAAGAALLFLSNEGTSSMKNNTSDGSAGRPQIDMIVHAGLKTATFAMG